MPEAPPVAPTPTAPAAPAAPAAAPAALAQSFDTSFPDDGLDTGPEPAAPAAPTEKPAAAEKPAEKPAAGKPAKAAEKPDEKAAEKPAPEGIDEFTPPQVASGRELRTWALKAGKRAREAHAEVQKLHSRIAQMEQAPPKQTEDNSALAKELASAKKRIDEYENDMRMTKYERSQEYAEKYQKPYQEAVAQAYRDVKELLAYEPNPDDPEGEPRERNAVQADFDEIYGQPLGQATRLAKQKFGDAAPIVLQHRAQIRKLAEAAYGAMESYKGKAGELENQTKAQAAQQEQAMQSMFGSATEGHAKRSPKLFLERDGDTEGNELLAKGKAFAGTVFGGNENLSPQQIAFRDAMAYNRLSAYPRLIRDVKKLTTELEEAQKTLAAVRASGPGKPQPGTEKADKGGYKALDQAFDDAVPA